MILWRGRVCACAHGDEREVEVVGAHEEAEEAAGRLRSLRDYNSKAKLWLRRTVSAPLSPPTRHRSRPKLGQQGQMIALPTKKEHY